MRNVYILSALCIMLCLSACQPTKPACPEGSVTYQDRTNSFQTGTVDSRKAPAETIDINGKSISFDEVIHGQLCNNHLSGTVYIGCDVVVYRWEETPNFLDACDFLVTPGSIIYVASHNNTAYYQGCAACHQSD